MNVIETHGLAKSFGKQQSLLPLDLTIPQGSIYALAGHNGAGKTTLLKLLLNILQPTAGSATILGKPSTQLDAKSFQHIGYVSENQEMPEWMTVRAFMDYLRPFYPTWNEGTLLQELDLPEDRRIKHLSRGMRMKLALASVIAFRPSLILMDEPFSGLDPLARDEITRTLLGSIASGEDNAPTIFISTHDLAEIESFATHAAMLDHGKLLFAEPLEELTARFREVTVSFNPGTDSPAKTRFPKHWLQTETSAAAVRFVHTNAGEDLSQEVKAALPSAAVIEAEPMSLRDIFLVLTKAGRAAADRSAA